MMNDWFLMVHDILVSGYAHLEFSRENFAFVADVDVIKSISYLHGIDFHRITGYGAFRRALKHSQNSRKH